MQLRYKNIYLLLLWIIFIVSSWVYAINIIGEWWQVSPGVATNIDVHANCKKITPPNDWRVRFIPTKTVAEWNSFIAAAPWLWIWLDWCNWYTIPLTNISLSDPWDHWYFDVNGVFKYVEWTMNTQLVLNGINIWVSPHPTNWAMYRLNITMNWWTTHTRNWKSVSSAVYQQHYFVINWTRLLPTSESTSGNPYYINFNFTNYQFDVPIWAWNTINLSFGAGTDIADTTTNYSKHQTREPSYVTYANTYNIPNIGVIGAICGTTQGTCISGTPTTVTISYSCSRRWVDSDWNDYCKNERTVYNRNCNLNWWQISLQCSQ